MIGYLLQAVLQDELHYMYDDYGGSGDDGNGSTITVMLGAALFAIWMAGLLSEKIRAINYYFKDNMWRKKLSLKEVISYSDFWKEIILSVLYICALGVGIAIFMLGVNILSE